MKRPQNNPHFASLFNPSEGFIQVGEEISFNENKNMVFSWPDFADACDLFQTQILPDSALHNLYEVKRSHNNKLKNIPLWFKTQDGKIHSFSMFELYEYCILNKFNDYSLDPYTQTSISFISAKGPYKLMAPSECLNKEIYQDFVMIYLLENKLPKRNFRIRLNAKVLFGSVENEPTLAQLQQITDDGLLFSVNSDFFAKNVAQSEQAKFYLNPEVFKINNSGTINDLQKFLASKNFDFMYSSKKEHQFTFNMTHIKPQSSFDFFKDKNVYIFVKYGSIESSKALAVSEIEKFVKTTKLLIKDSLFPFSTKKSA